jgi:OFA family oxalate/formate antiporter-like MFS transporter
LRPRFAWLTVAGAWLVCALLFGSAIPTSGLYYRAVTLAFHTSRAGVSLLTSVGAVGMCLGALVSGAMLIRWPAPRVIMIGALLEAMGFVWASRAHTFGLLLGANGLLGLGVGIGALIPVSFIIGNWFGTGAGLAMGLAMTGTSIGGSAMALIINFLLGNWGWRTAYWVLALPVVLIIVPLSLLLRAAPAQSAGPDTPAPHLHGLEVGAALRGREFWLIALCQFLFGAVAAGILAHLPSYLQGLGYHAGQAALAVSVALGITAIGKISLGLASDRIGSRLTVSLNFLLEGVGVVLLIGAVRPACLIAGIACYGVSWGAPLALLPLLTIESLGLKRYGAISGLTNLAFTAGNVVGPLAAGRVFDLTGSYRPAFVAMALAVVIDALAVLACRPLETDSRNRHGAPVSERGAAII